MTFTAGIDVGSTYTKAAILGDDARIAGRAMLKTGFKLADAARRAYDAALAGAGIREADVAYLIATGYGRHQVTFADVYVTDLTAAARGATLLYPGTRTILDVGGQTMKATRVDALSKVRSFRLNDKCAAGTGAFLEKTARYMGYGTEEIGPLAAMSKTPATISGVCAVFAESEVINHLSQGTSPSDIMQGAIESLVDRSIQLMRRVQLEPEYTLVGGILRFESMGRLLSARLGAAVNLPAPDLVQFVGALGAARLGRQRAAQMKRAGTLA
ncbi:MAG: 2-hydroxyglutaryl-CoA dehydratase [Acidobacteria bacterium]|nr:2-hydroxyglutaryl-CoA dehydratase [Acidobacteriota bacterium]